MTRGFFRSRSIRLVPGIVAGLLAIGISALVRAEEPDRLPRLISLNPSLTAIVFRLGGGDSLVGVDDYSTQVVAEAAALRYVANTLPRRR